MESGKFELEIEGKLENLSLIGGFISEAMRKLGVEPATFFKVQLAIDEACTNIIQHAYSEQKGIISITCELVDDDFVVTIRDRGKPFDYSSVSPPDLEAELNKRKVGGLEIYFMRELPY
ncbi:MAG: ATP-binding protein [Proteobacteria bacterium]|nr:ATP-binding protein [Pseudomonadota bacterium]